MIEKTTNQPSHLEALAASVDAAAAATEAQPGQDASGAQAVAAAPAIDPAFMSGIAMLPLWALKALRDRIAKRLPEIREHWTDEALSGPANALPPLLMRYLASLAPVINENPELSVFFVSLVPLVMGYLAASSQHDATRAQALGQGEPLGTLPAHELAEA